MAIAKRHESSGKDTTQQSSHAVLISSLPVHFLMSHGVQYLLYNFRGATFTAIKVDQLLECLPVSSLEPSLFVGGLTIPRDKVLAALSFHTKIVHWRWNII